MRLLTIRMEGKFLFERQIKTIERKALQMLKEQRKCQKRDPIIKAKRRQYTQPATPSLQQIINIVSLGRNKKFSSVKNNFSFLILSQKAD